MYTSLLYCPHSDWNNVLIVKSICPYVVVLIDTKTISSCLSSVLSLCSPPYCESWQCPHDLWRICLYLCPHCLYGCVLKRVWISPNAILLILFYAHVLTTKCIRPDALVLMVITTLSLLCKVYVLMLWSSWTRKQYPHVWVVFSPYVVLLIVNHNNVLIVYDAYAYVCVLIVYTTVSLKDSESLLTLLSSCLSRKCPHD